MHNPEVKDLQKSMMLYVNSAAVLLRQAESVHGAPALKPPEGALHAYLPYDACTASQCPSWSASVGYCSPEDCRHISVHPVQG